jgi:stage V sporulation protein R
MEFLEMQKSYEYGLSKIYEMVINTDPSYAYLMDCNLVVDQKLVMAHVFGHVDFFKNNLWFADQPQDARRDGEPRARVRRSSTGRARSEVERSSTSACRLDNLDRPVPAAHPAHADRPSEDDLERRPTPVGRLRDRPQLHGPHINPPEFLKAQRERRRRGAREDAGSPRRPCATCSGFLLEHARCRVAARHPEIIRDEAYYFAPQARRRS